MTVLGMLRVKNEARWIERCLSSILPLCDQIIVMDDHSSDDTLLRCRSFPKVNAFESPFEADVLNEARDKNLLLDIAKNQKPDWIIAVDGDEVLAPGSEQLLRAAMAWPLPCLSLRVRYLWDRADQVRADGVYGDFHRESVFRPVFSSPEPRFLSNSTGGNFHCGNVPWALRQKRSVHSEIELLHFGYLHREDRERKYAWYNARDPNNAREDRYRHMVIGDIFPADSRFAHGGPLRLEPL